MQLSEKELLMVSDSLMGHLSTVEKFRSFSQACSDQEMKQLLDSHARKMERHGQELMNMVQTSAMTGTSGYSPYSQSPQYGGSQYGTQAGIGSQYGTQAGIGSQYGTQSGIGSQSQYGTQTGIGSQYGTQYGMGSQSQYGTQHGIGSQGQYGTQYGASSPSQFTARYGESSPSQYGTQFGAGSQGQYGTQSGIGSQYGTQYGGTQSQYQQKY